MAKREGETLSREAARWLARRQSGSFSPEDQAELDRWLQADPAHAVAYARAEYAWERAERLRAVAAPMRAFERRTVGYRWAVAATLAVVMLGVLAMHFFGQSDLYATAVGERKVIVLEDGSQMTLNTASRVRVDFDDERRLVHLKRGEALFNVAHDASRPFIVKAGNTQVRAVGTAFNVRVRSQVVEITVTEGVVAVEEDHISAGSAAVVVPAGAVNRLVLPEDELQRRVAWLDGVIELNGETLQQAVDEFNRYRTSKLVVADPAIATIRVGGRFETDEADKFVSAISTAYSIRVVEDESGAIYLLGPE